jgi:hypothetical protein
VTLPAQISAAIAEQAAEQISAAARGGQARFAIRPGGPLHRITEFAGIHPLPAVHLTSSAHEGTGSGLLVPPRITLRGGGTITRR